MMGKEVVAQDDKAGEIYDKGQNDVIRWYSVNIPGEPPAAPPGAPPLPRSADRSVLSI